MITKDMIIGEIIRLYPETVQIFLHHNLDCYACQLADIETIEHGAGHHHIALELLLAELNSAIEPSRHP